MLQSRYKDCTVFVTSTGIPWHTQPYLVIPMYERYAGGRSKDTAAGERGELFRRARTVAWSFSRNTLPLRRLPPLASLSPSPSLSFLGTLSLSRVLSRCSGRSPGVPCQATASAICVENAAQLARFGQPRTLPSPPLWCGGESARTRARGREHLKHLLIL